jgi:diguanylate cyclase (GGDEF)-like protein
MREGDVPRNMQMIQLARAQDPRSRRWPPRGTRAVWIGLGALGAASVAWLVLLLLASGSDLPFDGWFADGIEVAAGLVCLARARRAGGHPGVALALGAAVLSWAAGDIVTSIQAIGGSVPPTPGLDDLFYLGFYPLAYIAVVLFLRREVTRLSVPSWLDGLIVGLGAAAVSAEWILHQVRDLTGATPLWIATNLAYPTGDLLLLGLTVGTTALLPSGRRRAWVLVAFALAVDAIGDSANLLHRSAGLTGTGRIVDGLAWPVSSVLMAAAVWMRAPPSELPAADRQPGFVLPQLAGVAALAVLLVGTMRRSSPVALGFAAATLLVVGIRWSRSVHVLRAVGHERQLQSVTDDLTGLANRRHLIDLLERWFASAGNGPRGRQLAFLFLDLNAFKEINDHFGHPAGDEVLRQLGPRLKHMLRSSDVLVRLGGDEFAVVLRDADLDYATTVARRLTDVLRSPFDLGAVRATVGASIGIAMAPTDARGIDDLVRCADVAMYRAKATGLPWVVYDRVRDGGETRIHSAEELAAAIRDGDLVVHYQPQLEVRSRSVIGVEALVRWTHPALGLIPPDHFLPLAEEAGLMPAVTSYVLGQALERCAAWRRDGLPLTMSVNTSPANLIDPGFVAGIRRRLAHHNLPGDALILEITETTAIANLDRTRTVIAELARLGVVVSIDDFGAGFTSLAYLGNLAVGELKLDQMFMAGLADDQGRDEELVKATIRLAHALQLRVVAEGVETSAMLEQLTTFGCDVVQGHLISRPLPADDLMMWLRARCIVTPATPPSLTVG